MNIEEKECRALFSRNIKRFRARLGLSQLNLALDLNISPTFLSDIENGKKWVSPLTLVRIAKALKVETYELFKPEKVVSGELSRVLEKVLNDVELSVHQSMERSIEESITKLRAYYLATIP